MAITLDDYKGGNKIPHNFKFFGQNAGNKAFSGEP